MEARLKGGDNMSLEAVQMVTETEQRALQRKAEAVVWSDLPFGG